MNKFFISLCVWFVSCCAFSQGLYCAEKDYIQYIDSVLSKSNADKTVDIQIKLNDGTVWDLVKEAYDKDVVLQIAQFLTKNKRVYLDVLENTKLFLLTLEVGKYNQEIELVVELSKNTSKFLKIVNIQKFTLLNPEDKWDNYGYRYFLSDGSTWEKTKNASLADDWKIGDRVIPTSWLFNHWLLINIDCCYFDDHYFDSRDMIVSYIK